MFQDDSKETLLSGTSSEWMSDGHDYFGRSKQRRPSSRSVFVGFVGVSLVLSMIMNAVLVIRTTDHANPYLGPKSYSGLPFDTPLIYRNVTDFWGKNETLSDTLWDTINTDGMVVALSKSYIKQHNLEPSDKFPWDDEKDIYFVKVYHHLHCLKIMRRSFKNYQRGNQQTIPDHHIDHCLDALRQDISCKADDTPMPITHLWHVAGNGQTNQCRDINKLAAWTKEPQRNACYKMLDDFRPIKHSLERHAFCPEGSPYYHVSKSYFEKYGHKDPFQA